MILYFCLMLLGNIIMAILCHQYITVTAFSLIPLLLIGVMAFQAHYFKSDEPKNSFGTAYHSGFTHKEEGELSVMAAKSILGAIPFMIPFILFFPAPIKACSVIVYLISFGIGPIVYRIKYRNNLNQRTRNETKELQAQFKKEELGKWK